MIWLIWHDDQPICFRVDAPTPHQALTIILAAIARPDDGYDGYQTLTGHWVLTGKPNQ